MSDVVFSIKPEFIEQIFSGAKRFEYRKVRRKRPINKIIIYATCDNSCTSIKTGMIVGYAEVREILDGTPDNIWSKTQQYSGVTKDFFDNYYSKSNYAVAYQLGWVHKYSHPRPLSKYGIKSAPQSYVYI